MSRAFGAESENLFLYFFSQKVSTKCPQKSVSKKYPQKKCQTKVSTKSVHKKCPQKAKGEQRVSGRGVKGERQGRGR